MIVILLPTRRSGSTNYHSNNDKNKTVISNITYGIYITLKAKYKKYKILLM